MRTNTLSLVLMAAAWLWVFVACDMSASASKRPSHRISTSHEGHSTVTSSIGTTGWVSNAAADQLGADVPLPGGYVLKPPANYTFDEKPIDGQNSTDHSYEWRGNPRADGSYPTLDVSVLLPSNDFQVVRTSGFVLKDLIAYNLSHFSHFVHTPLEHGEIAGVPFVRTYCKYDKGSLHDHGFLYVSADENSVIVITAEDVEPYNQSTLRQIESSVLTVHPDNGGETEGGAPPASVENLAAARRGYTTRLIIQKKTPGAVVQPPAGFELVHYEAPLGSFPAYVAVPSDKLDRRGL